MKSNIVRPCMEKGFFLPLVFLAFGMFYGAIRAQAQPVYEPYDFGTYAGAASSSGSADGIGPAAGFNGPSGVTVDGAGNLYVADQLNHTIRKIAPSGSVTTVAGLAGSSGNSDGQGSAARFNKPSGVALDGAGNVYVGDQLNHTIRKISPAGVVSVLAGLAGIQGGTDGAGNVARFSVPRGLAVDTTGNLYVADSNSHTIRKITPVGVVSTLAGSAFNSGSADGTGAAARFNFPTGVTVDSTGNVYVADWSNSTIRKITPAGVVSTLAGLAGNVGTIDGTGSAARFSRPLGLAVDSTGNVFVADTNNQTIRKITPLGVVTTVAGLAGTLGSADGAASTARFNSPTDITLDEAGNLYLAEQTANKIRKIDTAGLVSTIAGFPASAGSGDGVAHTARFWGASGVAVDSSGNVYVADTGNHTIRKISPVGVVSTLAGSAGNSGSADGTGGTARFKSPGGLAVDTGGNVYVADTSNQTIRKITPAGAVTTLAGLAGTSGNIDATGNVARFSFPRDVAVDDAGNVYVANTSSNTIRKITSAGVVTTLAGLAGGPGSADGTGSAARFASPSSVAVDSGGNVYVADSNNNAIRKITPSGVVTTLAGLLGSFGDGSADGTGSTARFNYPIGVAVDGGGNVYVANYGLQTIRKVTSAGVVTTLGGTPGVSGYADGLGSAARFWSPGGIAVNSAGNLYVADTTNNTIRIGQAVPLSLRIALLLNGHALLTGIATPGAIVDLHATPSLTTPFLPLVIISADAVGAYQFEDLDSGSHTRRFYRASLHAP